MITFEEAMQKNYVGYGRRLEKMIGEINKELLFGS
jgi:hypothetical protein